MRTPQIYIRRLRSMRAMMRLKSVQKDDDMEAANLAEVKQIFLYEATIHAHNV